MRSAALLLAAALLAAPAAAQPVRDPAACEALLAESPERAVAAARDWARAGGGAPAAICEALALEAVGALTTAAGVLQSLARQAPDSAYAAADRAALHELAAGFLLRDSAPAAALEAAQAGLALAPGDAALRRRAGQALAELDRPEEALAELNQALAADPDDVAGRLIRARLRLERDAPEAALADAAAAAALAPDSPQAWLLKGRAEVALTRRAEARESLLQAIALDREGPLGAEARRALQRMEVPAD